MDIIQKFNEKKATICIIGLGYVGLPLALSFAENEFKVIGLDIDLEKVDRINLGQSYIEHVSVNRIINFKKHGNYASTDFSQVTTADAIIICVPTPLNKHREPDLSFILKTMDSILPYIRENQILSLESTTWPGTTNEVIRPLIESRKFEIGKNYYLVYSPEREDPGRKDFETSTIPKICGGETGTCLEVGLALYRGFVKKVVPVKSTQIAEMTKLLENIHRSVNIGLVNELKILSDRMNIDIHEVIEAASTKPFGFTPYFPGPGIGGHCIPIDPYYLTWKAREFGVHTKFIELAGEINNAMPDYVVEKICSGLNRNLKSINRAKILILGIAYKENIDDVRESPSIFIMEKLREKGAIISYSDPHVQNFPKMREHSFDLSSVEISKQSLEMFDCVVLLTAHKEFDYNFILKYSNLIIDTRGKFKEKSSNIIKA